MPPETVWISNPEKLENQHGFTVAPGATKEEKLPFKADTERASAASMRRFRGEALTSGEVTPRLIHFRRGRLRFEGKVPPVIANTGVFLRPDVLAVLQEYDLGMAQVFPVALFDTTPDDPIGVTVWYLNPVNAKKTVDPDLSGLERPRMGSTVLDFYHVPDVRNAHRKIRTFPAALAGPDLWIDLMFPRTLFLSDRLARRLVTKGWQDAFDAYPTTLIV